ncbi:LCP family protein [Streptomyces sp. NPDC050504]|uniref:LCP family protein n=1 Tax=Streptomyces sp. NPDC050504 TaxID=3365618 RepID=UPI00378FC260
MGRNSVRGEGSRQREPQRRDSGWAEGAQSGGVEVKGGAEGSDSAASAAGSGSGGGRRAARGGRGARGARASRRRPVSKGKRILRWTASILSLLILGTAAAGYLYYEHLNSSLRKGQRNAGGSDVEKTAPNADGQTPLNILLIGSDSRKSKANQNLGGSRDKADAPPLADVQMLLHVSADRKNASVVSIPRDTRVDIPACEDPKTKRKYPKTNTIINESLARGGAGCTLATWQELTGIYIDHWITVDFAGVVKMSDAVGGAEVCVKQPVWDRPTRLVKGGSGLKLKKAGKQTLKGEDALKWLRTRHPFFDDVGRSKAQHMYMNSVIRNLKSQNAFTDTGRLMDIAEAGVKSLQVSEEIGSVKKLFDLGMNLKHVPTDRITMLTMPRMIDPKDENHYLPQPGAADDLWEMIREDTPVDGKDAKPKPKKPAAPKDPAAPAAEIGVAVRNGAYTDQLGAAPGRAGTVAGLLQNKGYAKAEAEKGGDPIAKTQLYFPSAELEGDAQAVAKSLGIPASQVKKSTDVSGVTLVVGADWRTGDAYPKPKPKKVDPTTTDASTASDESGCMEIYKPYVWHEGLER